MTSIRPLLPYANALSHGGKRCEGQAKSGKRCQRWTRVEYAWPAVDPDKAMALCATHAPKEWR